MSHPFAGRTPNRDLEIEYLDLNKLIPPAQALRHHTKLQIRAIANSIEVAGFLVAIVTDDDGRIIAGYGRYLAAKLLGLTRVPVVRVGHLDEDRLKAFMIADNRVGELSTWDDLTLGAVLRDLAIKDLDFPIEVTGFAVAEIELKIAGLDLVASEPAEPEVAPEKGPTVSTVGTLWKLGEHFLLNGSCLETENWRRLLGDERATVVIADPPYNVRIDGHVSGLGRHKHGEFPMGCGEMSETEFTDFLRTSASHARDWSVPGSLHHWAMDWRHAFELMSACRDVYERQINLAVWAKTSAGMGSYLRSQHELFFIYSHGKAKHRNNVQLGRFGRHRSNVWTYSGANSFGRATDEGNPLEMHPTVKPLALITDILLDCSIIGDIIVDPFLGSGTTIIAAEKLRRRARGFELDPVYCDTIIRRWQRWTGLEAARVSDGLTFNALEAVAGGAQ